MNNPIVPSIGISDANFPVRPDTAHAEDGYVYVIKFSDGTVKVGRSERPDRRLNQHRHDAAKFGLMISKWWVSEIHRAYKDNESSLKRFAVDSGALQGGSEYFKKLDFAKSVEYVKTLKLRVSTPDEIAEYERKREESGRAWRETLERSFGDKRGTVRVAGDSASWVLSVFFDPEFELPKFERSLTPEQNLEMANSAAKLADKFDSETDISEWGSYDYLCHILDTLTYSAKLEMKLRIIREGRQDMYDPWFDEEGENLA